MKTAMKPIGLFLLFTSFLFAQDTHTYTGAPNGAWNVAGNWTPAQIPADGDTVIINSNIATLSSITTSPSYLNITGSGDVIFLGNITVTGSVLLNGSVNTASNDFHVNGGLSGSGSLTMGGGTLTVGGDFSFNGYSGTNSLLVLDGAIQNFSSSATLDSVQFSGGGVASLAAALTVSGGIQVSSNTILANSTHAVSIGGDWDIEAGSSYNAGTSTVTLNGTSNQSISANSTFYNVVFSNHTAGQFGDKTALGSILIENNITINDSARFNGGSFTHTVEGHWNFTDNGTFTSSGTVVFNLNAGNSRQININGAQTYADTLTARFYNIEILGEIAGRTFIIDSDDSIRVENQLTVGTNTYLRTDASAHIFSNEFSLGGRLQVFGVSPFPTVFAGPILYSTTTSSIDGSVHFLMDNDAIISPSLTGAIDVYFQGPRRYTLSSNLDILDDLYVGRTTGGEITVVDGVNYNLRVANDFAVSLEDTIRLNKYTHYSLASDDGLIDMTQSGASFIVDTLIVEQQSSPIDNQEVDVNVTGAGAQLIINEHFEMIHPDGNASRIFNFEMGPSNILFSKGTNSITLADHSWISSTGETNVLSLMDSVETLNLPSEWGISYVGTNQTIATSYNSGNSRLTYSHIYIDNASKTLTDTLDIDGNFYGTADAVISDAGFPIYVAGDYGHENSTGYLATNTLVLDGGDQTITNNRFNNVIFSGSGTKSSGAVTRIVATNAGYGTITVNVGAWNFDGNVAIESGVTLDATTYTTTIAGNWINNGTFITANTSTFDGAEAQVITGNFYNGNFTNSADTIWASGNVTFANALTFNTNSTYADSGYTTYVGGTWVRDAAGNEFVTTGTVVFNGGNQTLNHDNGAAGRTFNNIQFSGSGTKLTADGGLVVLGSLTIDNGVTFNHNNNNYATQISGDFTNLGQIEQGATIDLVGGAQNINAGTLRNLVISGNSATKTLTGNLIVTLDLTINTTNTLDVGANYSIEVRDDWVNNGTFNAQNGTVIFSGAADQDITVSGSSFYNLTLNKSGDDLQLQDDLVVTNNLTIADGQLTLGNFNLNIGGSLTNSDVISQGGSSVLTFNASSGTHTIDAGSFAFPQGLIVDANGATYELLNNAATSDFRLIDGSFSLNGNTLTVTDSAIVSAGSLTIPALSSLELGSNLTTAAGASLTIVGVEDSVASITRSAGGSYTMDIAGALAAQHYQINYTNNGVDLAGTATVSATNNFSNGSFSNGSGDQYINYGGEPDAITTDTIRGVTFNAGPTNNVTRTAGTDNIVFLNSNGTLSGEANENDSPDGGAADGFIRWESDGHLWTGATSADWATAGNWTPASVPTASNNVIIPSVSRSPIIGAGVTAVAADIQLSDSLTLSGDGSLTVHGSFSSSGNIVSSTHTDTLHFFGDINNAGAFTIGENSTTHFGGDTVSNSIDIGSESLENTIFQGTGSTWTLNGALDINGDLEIASGTLSAGSNNVITVEGNLTNNGVFDYAQGTVALDGVAQSISGTNNAFYHLDVGTTGTKTLLANIDVNGDLIAGSESVTLDAGANTVYIFDDLIVNGGTIFDIRSTGTFVFDGDLTSTQTLEGVDTLHNLIFTNNPNRVDLNEPIRMTGDLTINFSSTRELRIIDEDIEAIGGSNTFNMINLGRLQVFDNNFPKTFETYNFDESTQVYYNPTTAGTDTIYTANGTLQYGYLLTVPNNLTETVVPDGDILAAQFVVANNAGITDLDSNSLTITNNFAVGASAIFRSAHSEINFHLNAANRAFDVDIDSVGSLNVHSNNGYILTVNDTVHIENDLSVNNTAIIDYNGNFINSYSGTGALTLAAGGRIYATENVPSGFNTYNFHPTSTYRYDGAGSQIVNTSITYGNIEFDNGGTVMDSIQANLYVLGNFDVFGDGALAYGADTLFIAGDFEDDDAGDGRDLQTSTIVLNGADQLIENNGNNIATFYNLVLLGSGTKSLGVNDDLIVQNDLHVDAGITLDVNNEPVSITGDMNMLGTFVTSGQTTTFTGTGQNLDFGSNTFSAVTFSTGNKTLISNPLVATGTVNIGTGVVVDFATMHHQFGGTFVSTGNGFLSSGTMEFNGAAGQNITIATVDTFENVTFSGSGTKGFFGAANWVVRGDLTNNSSAHMDMNLRTLELDGNFVNSSTLQDAGTIVLQGQGASTTYNFQTNNAVLQRIEVRAGATSTYQLVGASHDINDDLYVYSGTLDLNGSAVVFGNNTLDSVVVENGGTLELDSASSLQLYRDVSLEVRSGGALNMLGSPSSYATIIPEASNRYYGIDVFSGATIAARYYNISNIDSLSVLNGATVDNTNNFSDGIFSNGRANGAYLVLDHAMAANDTISNIQFNAGPAYNISRTTDNGFDYFISNYSGAFSGDANERDPNGQIQWLTPTEITWDGSEGTDWFDGDNWSTGAAPDSSQAVVIPVSMPNYPALTSGLAQTRGLTIQNGASLLLNGGNIELGSNGLSNSGVVVISASDTIFIAGDFVTASGSTFSAGSSGTVYFNGTTGAQSLNMVTGSLRHLYVGGNQSVNLATNIMITGDLLIDTLATLDASGSNRDITIVGSWTQHGAFAEQNAEVHFTGTGVSISGGNFHDLFINSSGTVSTSGEISTDRLIISSGTLTAGAPLDINSTNDALNANPAFVIESGATFNDGGLRHTLAGGIDLEGTYADNSGVLLYDGLTSGTYIATAGTLNNVEIVNENANELKRLNANLTVKSFKLLSGDFYTNTFTLTGTDTLRAEAGTQLFIRNTVSGFSVVNHDPASEVRFDGSVDIDIPAGVYGRLDIRTADVTKTLAGNVEVHGTLAILTGAILDVDSLLNYKITLYGAWDGDNSGIFRQRQGTVEFGGTSGINIYTLNNNTDFGFYNVIVNHSGVGTQVEFNDYVSILNDLTVQSGTLDFNNERIYLGGNLDNQGTIVTAGSSQLHLIAPASSSRTITSGGSDFDFVRINSSNSTYTLQDNAEFDDNFDLEAGTLDVNGQTLRLGDGSDAHTIDGTLALDTNSTLELYNSSDITVSSSGRIEVIGTVGNVATVTNGGLGRYAFSVNGTIAARNYVFEYMGVGGINLSATATIDATNNLSNGTFTNGLNGGTYLQVNNSQTDTISNVNFPLALTAGGTNVSKTAASGTLFFEDATGTFSGSTYENDPNNLVDWPTNIIMTWTGSAGTDWHNAANWSASQGPNLVPDSSHAVVIPSTINSPIVSSAIARAKDIAINSGAILTLNGDNLRTAGDFAITGTLTASNATDTIFVGGSWDRTGTFNHGSAVVVFEGAGGETIDNSSSSFNSVVFNGTGHYSLASQLNVASDLTVNQGTLDVTATDHAVAVGGSFNNNATFNAQNGTLTFTATSGTEMLNAGSSSLYNLVVNGTGGTFAIGEPLTVTNDLTVTSGTLDLNGQTLTFGNGSGDVLDVLGTLAIDENATLEMGPSTELSIASSGTLSLRGIDASNRATITRHTSGNYALNIAGTLEADFYTIEYTNASGLNLSASASLSSTYNLSNGEFSNGAGGGTYITSANTWPTAPNDTLRAVAFNVGPATNMTRTSGTGTAVFYDATGVLAGVAYENDSPDGGESTGRIHWQFSAQTLTWTGASDSDWKLATNWSPASIPDSTVNTVIPSGVGNYPIIDSAAATRNLTVNSGASLTISNNADVFINGTMTNAGTLTSAVSSNSEIMVFGDWENSGTFTANSSTVSTKAGAGTASITSGGSAFNNLLIDSTATIELNDALDVNGSLTIAEGTLDVSASNYQINLAGNWNNQASFNARSGRVVFDGASAQTITTGGTGASQDFYNITLNGAGDKTLVSNAMLVTNNATFTSGDIVTTNTLIFELGSSATVTGGSDASFVRGPAIVNWSTATASKDFPIGRGTTFRPLTMSFTSPTNPRIRAEVFNANPMGTFDGTITNVSDVRYYETSVLSGSTSGGTVGIEYGSDDGVGVGQNLGDILVVGQASAGVNGPYTSLGQTSIVSSVVTSQTYDPTAGNYLALSSVATPDIILTSTGSPQNGVGGQTVYMTTLVISRHASTSNAFWSGLTVRNRLVSGGAASSADIDNVYIYRDASGDVTPGSDVLIGSATLTGANGGQADITFSGNETITSSDQFYHIYYEINAGATGLDSAGVEITDINALSFVQNVISASPFPVRSTGDISLPVELISGSFTANRVRSGFAVTAETASEANVAFVVLQRSTVNKAADLLEESDWITINRFESSSDYVSQGRKLPVTLDRVDVANIDALKYRIITEELDGSLNVGGEDNILVVGTDIITIKDFALLQNYPNPFNPTTRIPFAVAYEAKVTINIYNVLGQKVRTLLNNELVQAGTQFREWRGLNDLGQKVASGIYFYQIVVPSEKKTLTKKMVLLK